MRLSIFFFQVVITVEKLKVELLDIDKFVAELIIVRGKTFRELQSLLLILQI
jgi:hypothetical protein